MMEIQGKALTTQAPDGTQPTDPASQALDESCRTFPLRASFNDQASATGCGVGNVLLAAPQGCPWSSSIHARNFVVRGLRCKGVFGRY